MGRSDKVPMCDSGSITTSAHTIDARFQFRHSKGAKLPVRAKLKSLLSRLERGGFPARETHLGEAEHVTEKQRLVLR